jgi:hypothetical protein
MDNQEIAEVKATSLKAKVDSLMVIDQASYDVADVINKAAYEGKKAFHEWFDPIDDASKKQRQATIAQGKKIDDPFAYVITETGKKMATWMKAEREKADEARRKAEEEARKIAEDAALKTAQALQDAGLGNAAEAVLEAPVVVPKIEVEQPTKGEGTYYIDHYSAEVSDLMALVKSVAEGKTPICYLQANEVALNGWARLTKGSEAMPGVKVVVETTQGRRGK